MLWKNSALLGCATPEEVSRSFKESVCCRMLVLQRWEGEGLVCEGDDGDASLCQLILQNNRLEAGRGNYFTKAGGGSRSPIKGLELKASSLPLSASIY